MRMFYCPKCGHFEMKKNSEPNPYKNETTVRSIVEWGPVPLQHYKCECGNYLAGWFDFITQADIENDFETDEGYDSFQQLGYKQKEDNILFYQDLIADFNEGGHFYNRKYIGSTVSFENFGEYAKWCYEDRMNKQSSNA